MTFMKKLVAGLACAAFVGTLAFSAGGAEASTVLIDFEGPKPSGAASAYLEDGFSFAPHNLQSGQCIDAQCPHLNVNDEIQMTYTLSPYRFSLLSLNLNFQGNGGVQDHGLLVFETFNPTNYVRFWENDYPHTGGDADGYYLVSFGSQFMNVASISFAGLNNANVRIDNITAAPIPLPAPALLLLGGLAGLGAVSRRRNRALA
jgi:hypothetical protein